jgi:esterase/lipase superfamily enzyme
MRVLYKRLLWSSFFLILLVGVAIVSAYFGRNFTGMGQTPARSAFTTRLPSIQGGNSEHFRFFYSTNRINDKQAIKNQGNQLSKHITFGTFDVRISPYLPIRPRIWFESEYMKWLTHKELTEDQFLSEVHQAVLASPQKSLLIIVWGYRDWFQSAALKTAYTAYVLDINTPILLFDWPGNQGDGFRGYRSAQRVANQSAPDLGKVLASVIRRSGADKVWLMGSSLGCQLICDSFDWLAKQPLLIQNLPKIDQVVLSAPDVSAQAFDEQFAEKVQALSRHLTAYVSSNDRALLMSYWLNGNRPLGRKAQTSIPPEARTIEYEYEEALELLKLQSKGAKEISVVDATPINRTRNLHHFFTDSPEFFDDLFRRLLQPQNNLSRPLYSVRTKEGTTYWILWNN